MKFNLVSILKDRKFEVLGLITFILIWQFTADIIVRNPTLLPSFTQSITALYSLAGDQLGGDVLLSLYHWGLGLSAALLIGIPLGAAIGWFRTAERFFSPIIEVLRPIPPLAWIPFAIVWLGLSPAASGVIIFVGAFFPILTNTYSGFIGVDKRLVDAAKVLGCEKELDLIRHVAIPSALPSIVSGVRIGMGIGWMCLVAAEIFGATAGLGYRLWRFYGWHMMDNVVAYMIVLGLIGLFMDYGIRYFVEEKFLSWQEER